MRDDRQGRVYVVVFDVSWFLGSNDSDVEIDQDGSAQKISME
jgi:hypothetical protein